jgi:hypothetical protein
MKGAFKPGEPRGVGSDFRVGRIDRHNPQIPCFVQFVALRGHAGHLWPHGGWERPSEEERRRSGILPSRSRRCSSWKNSPTKARKPGSPSSSPTERPSPGGPAFSRRRSAAAPPGRRSDWPQIHNDPRGFSMRTRAKSRERNGTKRRKKLPLLGTLGALPQGAQIPTWPGFTIVQAASDAAWHRTRICAQRGCSTVWPARNRE